MIDKEILKKAEELMRKSIDKFKNELMSVRTGTLNINLVENIKVDCYNATMLLNQVAGITIPDPKTIEIRPWDNSVLPAIEKAVYQSSIGLTPINDGKIIRLNIPPLTEERRKELVKYVHKLAEEFRVSIRNERHMALESIKKAEKNKKMSKDERFKSEQLLQKLTEQYIKKIDEIAGTKEKEIMFK